MWYHSFQVSFECKKGKWLTKRLLCVLQVVIWGKGRQLKSNHACQEVFNSEYNFNVSIYNLDHFFLCESTTLFFANKKDFWHWLKVQIFEMKYFLFLISRLFTCLSFLPIGFRLVVVDGQWNPIPQSNREDIIGEEN
jgi:hypothetical protein